MDQVGSLRLPPGSSSLTAHPTSAFYDTDVWIELGACRTKASAAAFWYAIRLFTREQHWNRTIFEVIVTADEHVPLPPLQAVSTQGGPLEGIAYGPYAPKAGHRYNALRTLSRKTPAPLGGGDDGMAPTYSAEEWTAQFVRGGEDGGGKISHMAVFGLVVPERVRAGGNTRALRYWPFQYPKVRCYRFSYEAAEEGEEGEEEAKGVLRYAVIPLGEDVDSARDFESIRQHSVKSAEKMLSVLRKRAESYDPATGGTTYVKRVVHDNLLTEHEFRHRYDAMKVKYNFWVEAWTECTDPVKFVYEELSIAAYLCALWDKERREEGLPRKQTFLDCGCGNGFLVYLLISEGHSGVGVDLQKRDIWGRYPPAVIAALRHEKVDPLTYDCSAYDWILGNHSDELSPWIPVMAARWQSDKATRALCAVDGETLAGRKTERELRRAYPRFFVLPCCFFDFDGKKVSFGRTRRTLGVRAIAGTGKYEQYYRWIAEIAKAFGFTTEYENLRIPSTKYVSLVGRFIEYEERTAPDIIKEMSSLLLLDARQSRM